MKRLSVYGIYVYNDYKMAGRKNEWHVNCEGLILGHRTHCKFLIEFH